MGTVSKPLLIIENDPKTLELYERTLSREYRVRGCSDEEDAYAILGQENWHAIVLEPSSWSGRGWDILTHLQHVPHEEHIPIILCSVLDERKRGLELGAAACLVKPVLPTTLAATLRQVAALPNDSLTQSADIGTEPL